MEQTIRFCTAPDGVRIAYATVGSGYPLVVSSGWVSHLELDWDIDALRRFWQKLGEHHLVARYDRRGIGLSDRNVDDFSPEAQVGDLCAVIDALDCEKVALMGASQGGGYALTYAHRYPERVSHLILYGTCASGRYLAISDLANALTQLIEADWGGMGSLAMADIFIPGATPDVREGFADYQRKSATAEAARNQVVTLPSYDLRPVLKEIATPTLVIHKRGDRATPFELGRRLARDLPNSRFLPLDGDAHLLTAGSTNKTIAAVTEFLAGARVGGPPPERPTEAVGVITRREKEVLRLIAAGKSNRQIADELSISVNTADRHVSNILTKIAASNRAEAASYAVRSGIAS